MHEILIVRTSSLGDILHGLPLASALKEAFPHSRLTWLVEERYADLLTGNPWIDLVVRVRFRDWRREIKSAAGLRRWRRAIRLLRKTGFDVCLDPQGLARSGLLSFLSGAPVRIGFPLPWVREPLNRLFTNVHPDSMPARAHVIDRNLALLHPLGVRTRKRSFFFHVPPEIEDRVHSFLEKVAPAAPGPLVVLHPGAGWPTKQWPVTGFAEVGRRLVEQGGARVLVFWGPGEKPLAERLLALLPMSARMVPETGLKEAMAFLKQCDLFLGGDSGPLHLASALGRPVVGLYGPSDPVRNGPFLGSFRVLRAGSPCGPCYRRRCDRPGCMQTISAGEVWRALADLKPEINLRRTEHGH